MDMTAQSCLSDEAIITSCKHSLQVWSLSCSKYLKCIHSYKTTGEILQNSLNVITNQLLLTAEQDKPLLHYWPINCCDEVKTPKLLLPETPNVIKISPDNNYLTAGINTTLYIWKILGGVLLKAQEIRHTPITYITFSPDTNYLLVGTQFGCVYVYRFAHLANLNGTCYPQDLDGGVKPIHSYRDHSAAIIGIHVHSNYLDQCFVTSSLDRSTFVYDLVTGLILLYLVCDELISSITVDGFLSNIYFGSIKGSIVKQHLLSLPNGKVHLIPFRNSKFIGHSDRITCLQVNHVGDLLVSGSDNSTIIVWNTEKEEMLHKLVLESTITNVKFAYNNWFDSNFQSKLILSELQQTVDLVSNKSLSDTSSSKEQDETCRTSEILKSLKKRLEELKTEYKLLEEQQIERNGILNEFVQLRESMQHNMKFEKNNFVIQLPHEYTVMYMYLDLSS